MTNVRNQFIWRPWVLVCDATFGHFFLTGKKRLIDLLNLQLETLHSRHHTQLRQQGYHIPMRPGVYGFTVLELVSRAARHYRVFSGWRYHLPGWSAQAAFMSSAANPIDHHKIPLGDFVPQFKMQIGKSVEKHLVVSL